MKCIPGGYRYPEALDGPFHETFSCLVEIILDDRSQKPRSSHVCLGAYIELRFKKCKL